MLRDYEANDRVVGTAVCPVVGVYSSAITEDMLTKRVRRS